ncbi:aminofutalosine synthase MqnE [Desulfurobacterium atlanticum]|uniref:Aminodeoxyfutalosine synthase n=1 Tax=Desulfurobacterium atlanticum TaxID=240169 RepID=A0A238ZFM4_9BACT|nr:aminofutalosine synthase MqnE [Desulfurobacterium atlanticum]SNR82090.1 aminodeoxyfutalosine synthase [Desulfurobacterium atlanticum]
MDKVINFIKDKKLISVAEKIFSGERLDFDDGLKLFESNDLLSIGYLASYVNEKKNQDRVYFNVNVHITPTNICIGTCKFCAFRKDKGDEGAYELTIEKILEKLDSLNLDGVTEVHIVGGLHPDWGYEYYLEMVKRIKERYPFIQIKAFTAEEIKYIAERGGKSVEDTLKEFKEVGLSSMPGGGGEIFNPEVRSKLCPEKISAKEYLDIHKTAHRLGIKTNATMLFGHVESYRDRVEHLLMLREAQDETGGFQAFIPLAFHPINTRIEGADYTTAVDEIKTLAVSRLLLDNFDHIKAYWIMLGEKVAQLSLFYGVDDLDGTVVEEEITQAAGAKAGKYMPKERLIRLIREAGKTPVERDALYNIINVY